MEDTRYLNSSYQSPSISLDVPKSIDVNKHVVNGSRCDCCCAPPSLSLFQMAELRRLRRLQSSENTNNIIEIPSSKNTVNNDSTPIATCIQIVHKK